jgi:RNA polymerase sigma-70 factor
MLASCPAPLSDPPSPPHPPHVGAGAEVAFREALTDGFDRLELCDRNLLRFHCFHRLSADQLAEMFCVPRAAMTRQLAKIRDRVLRETRRGLAIRLALDKRALDELLDLARSRFDLVMARMLGAPAITSASR